MKGTYLGHRCLALEATPHPVIDTFGFSPSLLYAMVAVGLMTPGYIIRIKIKDSCNLWNGLEFCGAFFDDLDGH